jgi:hypothetical protein
MTSSHLRNDSHVLPRLIKILWSIWESGRNCWDVLNNAQQSDGADEDGLVMNALRALALFIL